MSHKKLDWIVIGISGVTCSGKTTLANQLKKAYVPIYIFNQDKYFYPDDSPIHIKCPRLEHNNYDILSALDMEQMYDDVISTMKGTDKSHFRDLEREPGKMEVPGKKILIIEGFTVLNYKPLLELCDLRYYLVLEYGECVARRCLREYCPPDIPGYFEQCVWPEHQRYKAQIQRDPRIKILDATAYTSLETVTAALKELGAKRVHSSRAPFSD